MNLDLTRRTWLHLASAPRSPRRQQARARAKGNAGSGGPIFANRTPMRIGTVTIRVRKLDAVADFYRDVLGLAVMERTAAGAVLGSGGVKLLVLEASPQAVDESRQAAGLYHTAFLMPSRKDLARWLVHAALNRVPLSGFADHRVSAGVFFPKRIFSSVILALRSGTSPPGCDSSAVKLAIFALASLTFA